jgi:predicted phage terminase large subunit-like protein
MTRWHEDDLAGRLLQQQVDQWTILRLPALAETQKDRDLNDKYLNVSTGQPDPLGRAPGEPLCPVRFSRAALDAIQADVGTMVWSAEYQGVPRAAEGNKFKRHWFPIVDAAPAVARRVRYWDKAGTAGDGDYTVGLLMAEAGGLYYVEDVVRGQWSDHQRETVIRQTAALDAAKYANTVTIWVEQEGGSGGKDSARATIKNLAGFPVKAETVSGNKTVRAAPFAAQCEASNVRMVRGSWNGAYLEELCAFPNGKNDDQVDGSSGAFNKLALGETEVAADEAQVTPSPF